MEGDRPRINGPNLSFDQDLHFGVKNSQAIVPPIVERCRYQAHSIWICRIGKRDVSAPDVMNRARIFHPFSDVCFGCLGRLEVGVRFVVEEGNQLLGCDFPRDPGPVLASGPPHLDCACGAEEPGTTPQRLGSGSQRPAASNPSA